MTSSVAVLKILDSIHNTLIKMEERLENIESHLNKYEPNEEKSKKLLNE